MARWIVYSDPQQSEPADWSDFERRLASSGLRVTCDPKIGPGSKQAHVYVDDPKLVLECPQKGYARCQLLAKRVRGLIKRYRAWEKGQNDVRRTKE